MNARRLKKIFTQAGAYGVKVGFAENGTAFVVGISAGYTHFMADIPAKKLKGFAKSPALIQSLYCHAVSEAAYKTSFAAMR